MGLGTTPKLRSLGFDSVREFIRLKRKRLHCFSVEHETLQYVKTKVFYELDLD